MFTLWIKRVGHNFFSWIRAKLIYNSPSLRTLYPIRHLKENKRFIHIIFDLFAVLTYIKKEVKGQRSCRVCGYSSHLLGDVKRHVESKHMAPQYPCHSCGKLLKTRRTLMRHAEKCQQNPPVFIDEHIEWNFL